MVVFLPFLVESLYSTIVNQKAYECKRDREFVELLDKEEAQFYNGYVTDRNWYHHIIKMVTSGAARLVGQVGQWAMAHLKGLGPNMTTLCAIF